jgi:glucosamine kinase
MKSSPSTRVGIGIDIGGTKTHLRTAGRGVEHRDLVLPTADWRVRQWEKDAESLLAIIHDFAAGTPIAAIAIGAHGCDDQSECDAFQTALVTRASLPVQVVNDSELLPAAFGMVHEIGLVAGTGSIAVQRTRAGRMLVAGGWGWVIGDEGSAPGLVREAGRAVARHLESGGASDEPLVRDLFAALEIRSSARIGSAIARCGGATALGRHAPVVFEAAQAGSALAHAVIREAGTGLAALLGRLRQQGADAEVVVAGGGVIAAQPLLWASFRDAVAARFAGQLTPELYTGAPVEGACRLVDALISVPSPL